MKNILLSLRSTLCFYLLTATLLACTGPVLVDESREDNTPSPHDTIPVVHQGTISSPYSIAEAQQVSPAQSVWVEGYIVGCVKHSMANGCTFASPASTASNILLADTFPVNDPTRCIPVELPGNSAEREILNLYDNASNWHRKVYLLGDMTLYYSVPGMKKLEACSFTAPEGETPVPPHGDNDDNSQNGDDTNTHTPPSEEADSILSASTKEHPLTIAQGIRYQDDEGFNQAWIEGQIVGYASSANHVVFLDSIPDDLPASALRNVIIADSITERNPQNVIIVQLQSQSHIREAVNLQQHPENLHKQLVVKGRMNTYYGLPGCTDIPNGLRDGDTYIVNYFFILREKY